jgi:WD40 repeat protein
MAFSPDGTLLASVSGAKTQIFDVSSQSPDGTPLPVADVVPSSATVNGARSLAFSPDSGTLAVGDLAGQIRLWDVDTHQPEGRSLNTRSGPVDDIAFDPSGGFLAADADGEVQLWNLYTDHETTLDGTNAGFTGGIAFSPDGSTFAEVVGCQLKLWDPVTNQPIGSPIDLHYVISLAGSSGVGCDTNGQLAFTSDGSLVVNLDDGGPIYVWSPLLSTISYPPFRRQLCAEVGQRICPS